MDSTYYEEYWKQRIEHHSTADPLTPARVALFRAYVQAGARVLDLGCGVGDVTALLAESKYDATGVDVSEEALQAARAKHRGISVAAIPASGRLPFEDASFDAVYCAEVIEHVFDPRALLAEISRALRPGGIALVSTPYHGTAKNVALAIRGFDKHFDPVGPHIRFFTERSLRALADACGLTTIRARKIGRFAPLWKDLVVVARKR